MVVAAIPVVGNNINKTVDGVPELKRLLFCAVFGAALLLVVYRPAFPTKHVGPAAAATIRKGKTTKQQVRALLGDPQDIERQVPIRQTSGTELLTARYFASEIWTYWTYSRHGTVAAPGARHSRYFVVVYFDAQGTVLDCETEVDD